MLRCCYLPSVLSSTLFGFALLLASLSATVQGLRGLLPTMAALLEWRRSPQSEQRLPRGLPICKV